VIALLAGLALMAVQDRSPPPDDPAAQAATFDAGIAAAGAGAYEAGLQQGYARGVEDAEDADGAEGGGVFVSPDGRVTATVTGAAAARRYVRRGWRRVDDAPPPPTRRRR